MCLITDIGIDKAQFTFNYFLNYTGKTSLRNFDNPAKYSLNTSQDNLVHELLRLFHKCYSIVAQEDKVTYCSDYSVNSKQLFIIHKSHGFHCLCIQIGLIFFPFQF